jgi:hypothetical protein
MTRPGKSLQCPFYHSKKHSGPPWQIFGRQDRHKGSQITSAPHSILQNPGKTLVLAVLPAVAALTLVSVLKPANRTVSTLKLHFRPEQLNNSQSVLLITTIMGISAQTSMCMDF